MVTIVGNKLAHTAGDLDRVEALGELHPDTVDLHIEERCVGGRDVVIERIIHRIEGGLEKLRNDWKGSVAPGRFTDPAQRF